MQKQRRFRARKAAANDDDDGDVGTPSTLQQPARNPSRQQGSSKTDIVKKAGLLSFEDDEDGAPAAPAPARTVRAQLVPPLREESASNTQRSAAGLDACFMFGLSTYAGHILAAVWTAETMALAPQASIPLRSWRSCGSRQGACQLLHRHPSRSVLAASPCPAASRSPSSQQKTATQLTPGRWCDDRLD
jgi:hypothetical protein